MNPFYERAETRIRKSHIEMIEDYGGIHDISREDYDELYNRALHEEVTRIKRVLKVKAELQAAVPELGGKRVNRMLFITVRPIDIEFGGFKHLVEKFVNNTNKFEAVEYAYEQKGENNATAGTGFHVHIIARMTSTTRKHEVLSHCKSVFKPYCPQPDVKQIFSIDDLTNKRDYIRDAKATDESKCAAHKYDSLWRSMIGINDIYARGDISEY